MSLEEMSLSQAKDLATLLGVLIALITLAKAVFEYSRQGKQKRAEYFLQMRNRIFEDAEINRVVEALDYIPKNVESLKLDDKEKFLGYLEEVAILMYSRLINKSTAHYMFGYYAILCWKNEAFWKDIGRDDPYWSLFRDFANEMIILGNNGQFSAKRIRI